MKKSIKDLIVSNKKVFVRVDFNVPLDESGKVKDNSRIIAALPTIRSLVERGAKVALCSHLGRPKGEIVNSLKMDPVAERLAQDSGYRVKKLDVCIGEEVIKTVESLKENEVVLLENIRFYPGETENDPDFSKQLAEGFDLYVNDAFGTAHRKHASVYGITKYLPAVAGLLMSREIEVLSELLQNPERPFVAIIGGAKISTKINVIRNLLDRVDRLILGGAMCFTFYRAMGRETGISLVEEEEIETARAILADSRLEAKIVLPDDIVVTTNLKEKRGIRTVDANNIPADSMGVDIGPETIKKIKEIVSSAKTIFWNGPLGLFEEKEFAQGTIETARALALSGAKTVVGGGDSISALSQTGLKDRIYYVSTGGGASLKLLEGEELPGVKVLQ